MSIHTYIRRYALFLTGVILSATGIAFITRAGLGTSPVSGLPFVLSLITSISMGTYVYIQYDVPDAGSDPSQEIYHPAGSADSGNILFRLLH